jgi:hypothetical protein
VRTEAHSPKERRVGKYIAVEANVESGFFQKNKKGLTLQKHRKNTQLLVVIG